MNQDINILHKIRDIAAALIPGCQVMLFGSRVRNDYRQDSDYDILIITNKSFIPKDKLPIKTRIRKELLKYGIFSDILIQSNQEIEVKKKLPGHIVKTIMNEGILI